MSEDEGSFKAAIIQKCTSEFSNQRTLLEQLNGDCDSCLERFDNLKERAEALIGQMALLKELSERWNALSETIDAMAERYGKVADSLDRQIKTLGESVDRTVDRAMAKTTDSVVSQKMAITGFVDQVTGSCGNQAEKLVEKIVELRRGMSSKMNRLLEKMLPGKIKGGAEPFLRGVKALKETGISKIKHLTDAFETIQEKTRSLTELIDAVKPVLEVVKQVL